MSETSDKDLLDELMGKTEGGAGKVSKAETELPDGPLPGIPDPNRLLDVLPEPEKAAAQRLDAEHSTQHGGEGYALTIEGQAYTKNERGSKQELPYKVTIKVAKLEGALSLLRKVPKNGGESFLDATVRKIVGVDFRGTRTYNIVGAVPLSARSVVPDNLQYMTLEQLKAVVKAKAAPIKLVDYGDDVVVLREAVMDFFLNPKGFEGREAKRSADIVERRSLESLNA